jgi:4-diphosphocytidyl-2-C-methyl-D-erythritol kinase
LPDPLVENAPAKVNLTLRVLARRDDGYHEILSLVAFADCGDRLSFTPGKALALAVAGPRAAQVGENAENLVLKAARALKARVPDITVGAFHLDKNLPVAAGLGGGSADAAAALRLIARANDLRPNDPRLYEAAQAAGADVPVCVDPRPRLMHGIGQKLSEPLALPLLHAVLVNPGVALSTKQVFAGWTAARKRVPPFDLSAIDKSTSHERFVALIGPQPNDLEAPAISLQPVIAEVLTALRGLAGCSMARVSGSGATCFALFTSAPGAGEAANILRGKYPAWWVQPTTLGSGG